MERINKTEKELIKSPSIPSIKFKKFIVETPKSTKKIKKKMLKIE